MLANIPRDFLLIFLIAVLVIAVSVMLFGIIILIRAFIKAKKSGDYNKFKYLLFSVLCVMVAAVSWIMNFGWIRFILTITAVPFIHAIAFFFINVFTVPQIEKSRILKLFTVLSFITYLCGYIFFPDGGDGGSMYAFFGLLHNDFITDLCWMISSVGFTGHIILLILQVIEAVRVKWKQKNQSRKREIETI